MIDKRTWYEKFISAHPEEEITGRYDEIDSEQGWRLDEFMEVLEKVDFLPEEESKKFYVSRKGR